MTEFVIGSVQSRAGCPHFDWWFELEVFGILIRKSFSLASLEALSSTILNYENSDKCDLPIQVV